jgi:hypothetical protein
VGVITLVSGEHVTSAQKADGFFIEAGDGINDLNVVGNTIGLKSSSNVNRGYIITVKRISRILRKSF